MEIGEEVRRRGFWAWDRMNGGPVRWHSADIARCWLERQYCAEQSRERVVSILQHATATVPFYRSLRGLERLERFPVVAKEALAACPAEFLSRQRTPGRPRFVRTGGSSGMPMVIPHDREKQRRRLAEVLGCNALAGYRLGMRHLLVRTKPKPLLSRLAQNEIVADASVPETDGLARQRALLATGRIRLLIGHASALAALARHCLACGDAPRCFSLEGVISYAEPLQAPLRAAIAEAFGCPVLDRYACEEFGILAHEVPGRAGLHVNAASYAVEILAPEEDRPAEPGELGRVVVTDLWNRAMPLIRFDTGDLAVAESEDAGALGGPVLRRLEGRSVEVVYTMSGARVPPLAVVDTLNEVLGGHPDVRQYQFAQTGEGVYHVRIKTDAGSLCADLVGRMQEKLWGILGPQAEVNIDCVNRIPALPSGKRPPVVNEWLKSSRKGAE